MTDHNAVLTIHVLGYEYEWLLTDRQLRILSRWLGPADVQDDVSGRRVRHGERGAERGYALEADLDCPLCGEVLHGGEC